MKCRLITPPASHLELTRRALRLIVSRDATASAAELARRLGVSEAHLRRVFVRGCGRRLGQHQVLVRLTRAAYALRDTSRPVLRIALEAGYANPESFSRAFRAAFGLSPRDYRRQTTISSRSFSMDNQPPVSPFRLALVKVPVRDFAAARAFYRDVLGLPETFAVEAYGWAQYDVAPLMLCLYVEGMGGGDGQSGGSCGFHLTHPDVAALARDLTDAGFAPPEGVGHSDEGRRFVVLKDPDGNTFTVLQADPADDPA